MHIELANWGKVCTGSVPIQFLEVLIALDNQNSANGNILKHIEKKLKMSSGFVSEVDLAERRKVRKEMWEKNKKDSDPDEPPEEPAPDHRSLKNMVRGLEDDEVDFLELVDNTKMQEEKRIREEELTAIQEYRKKVSQMQQKAIEAGTSESSSEEQHVGKTIEEITPKTAYIKNGLQCVAILPGLGEYTDSSDSENSETDSEIL
ncbi:hypothetical protein Avbf_13800, partial [Armadillidium vulgare]